MYFVTSVHLDQYIKNLHTLFNKKTTSKFVQNVICLSLLGKKQTKQK